MYRIRIELIPEIRIMDTISIKILRARSSSLINIQHIEVLVALFRQELFEPAMPVGIYSSESIATGGKN